jgi:uncharacterized protein (DUF2141 family)
MCKQDTSVKKQILLIPILFFTLSSWSQQLSITIDHPKKENAILYVAVYSSEAQFKSGEMIAKKKISGDAINKPIVFSNLPKGKLSVAVYFDTNKNEKLDVKKNGIPTEPFGFSNNPGLGVPSFLKTAFTFEENTEITIKIKSLP